MPVSKCATGNAAPWPPAKPSWTPSQVYVLDRQAADHKTATAERIAHQIVTNDQRSALTDAQRVKGITQMLLVGVSPAKVAKKLAVDRDTVTAAASVADSPTALAALEDGQLSLAEAAALREFEDDEHAVNALLTVAGGGAFDHLVAQLRQDRIAEQARTDAEMTYRQQGFMILTERPPWRDTSLVLLRHLRTPDSHEATQAAVTDPAHWAVLLVEDTMLVDTLTGEQVDEADVDWSTEHHPERQTGRRRSPCRHRDGQDRVGSGVLLPRPASLRPHPGRLPHPRRTHGARKR
jgi:ParB family chromosome partitioning protein